MTDEQIKQNAEAYARQFLEPYNEEYAPIKYITAQMAHIAGAHSRDEEIKELKWKLAEKSREVANAIADKVLPKQELYHLRNPWISVKDRLPEEHRTCELYDSAGYYHHGYLHKGKWYLAEYISETPDYITITHWRYTTPPNKQV